MQFKLKHILSALIVLACVRTAGATLLGIGNVNYSNLPYVTAQGVHGALAGFPANTAYHWNGTTGTFAVDATGQPSLVQGTVSWGENGVETFFTALGRQLGKYHLELVVDQNGNVISGSLEVRGDRNGVAGDGVGGRSDEILFSSNKVVKFGWTTNASVDKFEIQFQQSAVNPFLASYSANPGIVSVLLDLGNTTFTGVNNGLNGPFNIADFFVSGQHSTAFYPEPSAVMGMFGIAALFLRRRR